MQALTQIKSLSQDFTSNYSQDPIPSNMLPPSEKITLNFPNLHDYCLCDLNNPSAIGNSFQSENANHMMFSEIAGGSPSGPPALNQIVSMQRESMGPPPIFSAFQPGFTGLDHSNPTAMTGNPIQSLQAETPGMEDLTVLGADNQGIEFNSKKPHKRLSNLTKSKVNMKLLQNYNCKIEKRKNGKGGVTTVYICKYNNCNKEFTRTWSIIDHVRMHEGVRPYKCKY